MSVPVYDLSVAGFVGFTRVSLSLAQRKLARDPLSGVVNATNRIFMTTFAPMLSSGSSPLRVYDGVNSVVGSADFDTGEITLNNVPTNQPLATYTYTPYTGQQVLRFLINGAEEMEARWPRGYKLVDAAGNAADENSAQVLIADSNGGDPVITSSLLFSTSFMQQAFLLACADYRYNVAVLGEAARTDHMIREGFRGMLIDKSRRPSNIELALKRLDDRLDAILGEAQGEQLGNFYGAFVSSPLTLDYLQTLEWQTSSKLLETRSQAGFHVASRLFN